MSEESEKLGVSEAECLFAAIIDTVQVDLLRAPNKAAEALTNGIARIAYCRRELVRAADEEKGAEVTAIAIRHISRLQRSLTKL